MKINTMIFIAGVALLTFAGGCATTASDAYFRGAGDESNVYVAKGDISVKKMAVMPFKAETELAGTSVADMFVTEK